MDIRQVAKYFDTVVFDSNSAGVWSLSSFTGQLKLADKFVSIWNRPTRKRMLYTAPGELPDASVIRINVTGEVLLVGTTHADLLFNKHTRDVTGCHLPSGIATVSRTVPGASPSDPGWGTPTALPDTYADAELRSVVEDQNREIDNFGHYVMFFPRDYDLQRHDNVTLNGETYHILETYTDSGYLCARSTVRPDERINFVYTKVGPPVYNPVTQTNTPVLTNYNVTGKFTMLSSQELGDSDILNKTGRVMIHEDFIGVVPAVNDQITIAGQKWRVVEASSDSLIREWYLKVKV